jgi:hypothetical protein
MLLLDDFRSQAEADRRGWRVSEVRGAARSPLRVGGEDLDDGLYV